MFFSRCLYYGSGVAQRLLSCFPDDLCERMSLLNCKALFFSCVAYLPGVFLILLGIVVLVAPSLTIALAAAFCVSLGTMLCVIAWKVLRLKQRLEYAVRDFNAEVVFRTAAGERMDSDIFPEALHEDTKKNMLH